MAKGELTINSYLVMNPGLLPGTAQEKIERIINILARNLERFSSLNYQPIVLYSAEIRSHFKKLFDWFIPNLVGLSYSEILNNVKIRNGGAFRCRLKGLKHRI